MLYFIPTPIGNKEDITLRGLKLLQSLDFFICEDTRTLKKLMDMYDIPHKEKHFFSLTSFTSAGEIARYAEILRESDIGLTSEAWTPGLSDPGKIMVQICHENNLPYTVLPGANALVPAVVWSAFDTSSFIFLWFFPAKKGRQTALKRAMESQIPTFFYESVHRMEKLIKELDGLWFTGTISISRELSKMFEQVVTCPFSQIKDMLANKTLPMKGEFVVGIKK